MLSKQPCLPLALVSQLGTRNGKHTPRDEVVCLFRGLLLRCCYAAACLTGRVGVRGADCLCVNLSSESVNLVCVECGGMNERAYGGPGGVCV